MRIHLKRIDQFLEIGKNAADYDDTDSTSQFYILVANLERVFVDVIDELLPPCFRVSFVASFEQRHYDGAFESAGDVPRMHACANFLGKLRQDLFGIENSQRFRVPAKNHRALMICECV